MTLLSPTNSLRTLRALAVSAMLALVAGFGLVAASPAQAVTGEFYQNTDSWGCILGPGFGNDPDAVAKTGTCGGNHYQVQYWNVIAKGTSPSDHKLVQLK